VGKNKIDKKKPLENKHIRAMLHSWRHIPYDGLKEILQWKYIHKSPCSFSFYDHPKDWNKTEEGTIRVSDHWNFFAAKRGRNGVKESEDRLHSITDIPVEENVWYRGEYSSVTDSYTITHNYGKSLVMNNNLLSSLKESVIVEKEEKEKVPFPQERIDIKRNFSENIKQGNVFIYVDGEYKIVKKLSRSRVNFMDKDNLVCINSNKKGSWFDNFKNVLIKVNDIEYSENTLRKADFI